MGLLAKQPAPPAADIAFPLTGAGKADVYEPERQKNFFPAEWHPQSLIQLTFPHEATDWQPMLTDAVGCYVRLAFAIATRQPLLIVTPQTGDVEALLRQQLPRRAADNIYYIKCDTNDTWARDHAFLTVIRNRRPQLLDFGFNGWGGKFPAQLDNAINRQVFADGRLHGDYHDRTDFILEGGSLESDGRGTLLTTKACLLALTRNPSQTRTEIETYLKETLYADRVLWLEHGHLEGDDTDSHIDTLARFCAEDAIAYVRCTDPADAHYAALKRMEEELQALRTANDQPYRLFPLPLPTPIFDGDERLPATYANFLILNEAVLVPTYGQPATDAKAIHILTEAFPTREVVGIDCRALIRQHGSLHCAAMQYPAGVFNP